MRALYDCAVNTFLGFVPALDTAPLLGYGIGRGAPVVTSFTGEPQLSYGEDDPIRNVNELGLLLGPFFIFIRCHLALVVSSQAVRAARRGALAGLSFAGYAGLQMVTGQITNSALNAFLPWFAIGIALAYSAPPPVRSRV